MDRSTRATVSRVAASLTNVTLAADKGARRSLAIYNESSGTLFVKFGATASATDYTVQIGPGWFYEAPTVAWSGRIDGLWSVASGAAQITEGF